MKLFGFEIPFKRKTTTPNFLPPDPVEGPADSVNTYVDSGGAASGWFNTMVMNFDPTSSTAKDAINKYRQIANHHEVQEAITEIVNESIVNDDSPGKKTGKKSTISINLDNVDLSDSLKNKIRDEFQNVLKLLSFQKRAKKIFRRWYIDGRLYYYIVTDPKKSEIVELRFIDPRFIRKVRRIELEKDKVPGIETIKAVDEVYLYEPPGDMADSRYGLGKMLPSNKVVPIHPDSVCYVHSNLIDPESNVVLSYLHPAIKPLNILRMVEDSVVIYRLTRAPERMVFYIATRGMPRERAEAYVNEQMNRYKNKQMFDSTTGEIRDDRRFMSILDNYWIPTDQDGKGTKIDMLKGGENLGQIEDVHYFNEKLYQSLRVPFNRRTGGGSAQFNFGGSGEEILRDEMKFVRFIGELRQSFSELFLQLLRVQLNLKNIIKDEDWDEIVDDIEFFYTDDSHYKLQRQLAILRGKIDVANQLKSLIPETGGALMTRQFIQKNIFEMTDEEIDELDIQRDKESKDLPTLYNGEPAMDGAFGGFDNAPKKNKADEVPERQPKPKELEIAKDDR